MPTDIPHISLDRLGEVCRRYHVRRLSFFGSRARGGARVDSDIDILVEFMPGQSPGFAFARLQDELSRIFGCEVDLRTPFDLSRYFRDEVVHEARELYVAR
jgi:predicted nucleotidyltransferase